MRKHPQKKLTTCNWYIESRNGMPEKEKIIPPLQDVHVRVKPTSTQDNADIDRSWPKDTFHTVCTRPVPRLCSIYTTSCCSSRFSRWTLVAAVCWSISLRYQIKPMSCSIALAVLEIPTHCSQHTASQQSPSHLFQLAVELLFQRVMSSMP